jgi:hypothetical protein
MSNDDHPDPRPPAQPEAGTEAEPDQPAAASSGGQNLAGQEPEPATGAEVAGGGWTQPVAGPAGMTYAQLQAAHDLTQRELWPEERSGPGYTEPPYTWEPQQAAPPPPVISWQPLPEPDRDPDKPAAGWQAGRAAQPDWEAEPG